MAETYTQVAPNSTGNKIHARSYTVGADTVLDQYVIPQSERTRTGLYRADSGVLSLVVTAQTALQGLLWLVNPVGSTTAVAVKGMTISYSTSAATVQTTAPRISLERVTFTGTASGATVTPAKRVRTAIGGQTADATAVASIRTASTGLTLTAGEVVRTWLPPALVTAVGAYGGQFLWDPDAEDTELILAAGEGVVLRQPDAGGPTTESRRITVTSIWEEFTAP